MRISGRKIEMPNTQETNFIPTKLYNQIIKLIPIVSVEAAIQMDDGFLFFRRNNEPAKGEWWFPGGRIKKGETLQEALHREVKEETGLTITQYKLINVYSRVFPERHDITITYLCKTNKDKITLNNEHSNYKLFNTLDGLHPYIKQTIKDAKHIKI